MNTEMYLARRQTYLEQNEPRRRIACRNCFQPVYSCYCEHLKPFDPGLEFVILIHPIEASRRIATGRMSHLCLKNSTLIRGHTFSENQQVNALLQDPIRDCKILYPGPRALDLSLKDHSENVFKADHKPVLFVIDGTWGTAKTMVNSSKNLSRLPRVQFTPKSPSRFRVRKQPKANCYSTIEAIHQTIELLAPETGFSMTSNSHHHLIELFDRLVDQQIELSKNSRHRKRLK